MGFSRLCYSLWRHPDERLRRLPEEWLDELMSRVASGEVSATRRSAGLPFIVQVSFNVFTVEYSKLIMRSRIFIISSRFAKQRNVGRRYSTNSSLGSVADGHARLPASFLNIQLR